MTFPAWSCRIAHIWAEAWRYARCCWGGQYPSLMLRNLVWSLLRVHHRQSAVRSVTQKCQRFLATTLHGAVHCGPQTRALVYVNCKLYCDTYCFAVSFNIFRSVKAGCFQVILTHCVRLSFTQHIQDLECKMLHYLPFEFCRCWENCIGIILVGFQKTSGKFKHHAMAKE